MTFEKADQLGRQRAADKILSDLTKRNWDILLTRINDAGNLWQVKITRKVADIGAVVIVPFGRVTEGDYLTILELAENLVNEFEKSICGVTRKASNN